MNFVKIFFLFVFITSFIFSQLNGKKICIDPGHGGFNSNDRHVIPDAGINFWESESNFRKAALLKPLLEEKGAWVILTRTHNDTNPNPPYPNSDPDEPSLTARWELANANNVHWFHSIHSNASGTNPNLTYNYSMVLIKEDIGTRLPAFPQSVTMSSYIYSQLRYKNRTQSSSGNIAAGVYLDYTFYGGPNGGYNLGVLKGLIMPGELSEGSFHDYYPETRRLMNQQYRKGEAYAIRDAFMQYFNHPADTLSIIAGIQYKKSTGLPYNGARIKLLPENIIYTTDNFNNGFYFFDNLSAGQRKLIFETNDFGVDTVIVNLLGGRIYFVDLKPEYFQPPQVLYSQPSKNDTSFAIQKYIGIRFSKEMDTVSCRNAFLITPNIEGTITWLYSNQSLIFTPKQLLPLNTNFSVVVSDYAKSTYGIKLDGDNDSIPGGNFILNFKTESYPSGISNEGIEQVKEFKLYQNYPNPFSAKGDNTLSGSPSTRIQYSIANAQIVSLKIYDILGNEIAELINEVRNPGRYEVEFNAAKFKLASGIYYCQLRAGSFVQTKKMIYLK